MHFFVTVDAETDVIREGIRVISGLRDRVEERERARIPIVWFVRFQRSFDEYVENDSPAYFEGPLRDGFDGFERAKPQLVELLARGDEVGWHYHAYGYVHRTDLSHEARVRILEADLDACGRELRGRHPELPVRSFRFGWFFVPDYVLYETLRSVGIEHDASVMPRAAGSRVESFEARYLEPLASEPAEVGGLCVFPYQKTLLVHDWSVLAHDFGWSSLTRVGAWRERHRLTGALTTTAARLRRGGGAFLTYDTFPRGLLGRDAGA